VIQTGSIERGQSRHCELPDRILAGAILGELKQAALEYTEAALEATTPDVRRAFERLAYDTSRKHEQLSSIMLQNQLNEPAFAAPQQEIQREAQRSSALAQSLQQYVKGQLAPQVPAFNSYMSGQQRPMAPTGAMYTAGFANAGRNVQGGFAAAYQPNASVTHTGAQPPEFALPHNMPFGGLPSGSYMPPQPYQHMHQPQPQGYSTAPSSFTGAANAAYGSGGARETEAVKAQAQEEQVQVAEQRAQSETESKEQAVEPPKRGRRGKASNVEVNREEIEQLTSL
jgi:chemotaxis protein histidine kinase CheA